MTVEVGDENGIGATAELVRQYPNPSSRGADRTLKHRGGSARGRRGGMLCSAQNGSLMEVLHWLQVARPGGLMAAPAVLKRPMSTPAEPDETQPQVALSQRENEVLHFPGPGLGRAPNRRPPGDLGEHLPRASPSPADQARGALPVRGGRHREKGSGSWSTRRDGQPVVRPSDGRGPPTPRRGRSGARSAPRPVRSQTLAAGDV